MSGTWLAFNHGSGRSASRLVLTAALMFAAAASCFAEAPPKTRKWIGTWHEPNPYIGTRRIMELSEKGGKLVGKYSDPALPNGVFNLRMTFSLSDITVVDDNTLTWKDGGLKVTATYKPGEDGSPATMETVQDPKGTIGGYLGQTKPHVSRFKKQ